MPRFIFKNASIEEVKELSQLLVEESSTIIDCPEDWITFEYVDNHIFYKGETITTNSLFLEISWFKRSQETQDKLASYLYDTLNDYYKQKREITLIFNQLLESDYYEDGKNFS